MRPIVTDVAWSVDHNRTAKPTEVPFGVWTWVSLRKHVLNETRNLHLGMYSRGRYPQPYSLGAPGSRRTQLI